MSVHEGPAGHRFDQSAEARFLAPRPGLAPAGDAQDDELRIPPQQIVGTHAPALQRSGHEILDQDLRGIDQPPQKFAAVVALQIERDAALVARINFPENFNALDPPAAQIVALAGTLDFDDVGAVIGEHMGRHITGDESRQVDDAHTVEQARACGIEYFDLGHGASPGAGRRKSYGGHIQRQAVTRRGQARRERQARLGGTVRRRRVILSRVSLPRPD